MYAKYQESRLETDNKSSLIGLETKVTSNFLAVVPQCLGAAYCINIENYVLCIIAYSVCESVLAFLFSFTETFASD